jgi:hypothetical protein
VEGIVDLLVLTTLYAPFYIENRNYQFQKKLSEEVHCTDPFPSVRVPWKELSMTLGESSRQEEKR